MQYFQLFLLTFAPFPSPQPTSQLDNLLLLLFCTVNVKRGSDSGCQCWHKLHFWLFFQPFLNDLKSRESDWEEKSFTFLQPAHLLYQQLFLDLRLRWERGWGTKRDGTEGRSSGAGVCQNRRPCWGQNHGWGPHGRWRSGGGGQREERNSAGCNTHNAFPFGCYLSFSEHLHTRTWYFHLGLHRAVRRSQWSGLGARRLLRVLAQRGGGLHPDTDGCYHGGMDHEHLLGNGHGHPRNFWWLQRPRNPSRCLSTAALVFLLSRFVDSLASLPSPKPNGLLHILKDLQLTADERHKLKLECIQISQETPPPGCLR